MISFQGFCWSGWWRNCRHIKSKGRLKPVRLAGGGACCFACPIVTYLVQPPINCNTPKPSLTFLQTINWTASSCHKPFLISDSWTATSCHTISFSPSDHLSILPLGEYMDSSESPLIFVSLMLSKILILKNIYPLHFKVISIIH